jgi:siroheme synthase-like protein
MSKGNSLFPIFLKLNEIQTVLVGGGNVGLEKLEGLLKNDEDAKVRIIAPEIKAEIEELASNKPAVELVYRKVKKEDLEDADILILATDDRELHVELKALARGRKLLVNVADTPELCDFYLGSTVKKGDLKIGISTNGKSPTFAKQFRRVLEDSLPDDTQELLDNLQSFRNRLKGDFAYKVKRLNEITKGLTE